ncbi:MAG TPA: YraN family protein [Roseiarcus sp.]|nr:YraN family protein [Roseiarcus sp.]
MAAPSARKERSAAKWRAHRLGLRAEWLAAAFLVVKGYRILARKFVVAGGEIDLVARRGDVIAFVEVKARPGFDEALLAIDSVKRRRIARAARLWLTKNPGAMQATLRGDAVLIAPLRWPRHVEAAFELELE